MANRDSETPAPADPEAHKMTGIEDLFTQILGESAGPEAYQHMVGLVAAIDAAKDPPFGEAVLAYIRSEGIDPKLAVADGRGAFLLANSEEHAARLRRERMFSQVVAIGELILRAPR
jgi:hypothetical protein